MISRVVDLLFYFYYLLLIIRIFLTWIRTIDWYAQPYAWLRSITDPFLNIFRNIIPPIGGVLDISPILAIIILQLLQSFILRTLGSLGL
ncbi:MAG: YggT family protein [Candidatus Gastranaerophilales bacterium]|nr:YggT family protein [Candidatus Gastranaerophilales bacterium]MCM1072664.1 YggT family protein [Bacteroides sp.]